MRFARRLGGGLLLVALAGSCDTTQPLQVQLQTLGIEISANNARANLVDTWQFFQDNDQDQQADGDTFLFCQRVNDPPTTAISVPWNFSVQVTVLRAGETEPEVVTSAAALGTGFNRAKYDTTVSTGITPNLPSNVPNQNPATIDGNRYFFFNRRRLTTVHREVIASTSNPLTTSDPATFFYMAGLCSVSDPGPATIDGVTQPFTVEIGKGDTVILEARKSLTRPPGIVDNNGNSLILPGQEPRLLGQMFLDGNRITAQGVRQSTDAPGDGILFRFTSR